MKYIKLLLSLCIGILLISIGSSVISPVFAIDYTNTEAVQIVGQPDFDTNLGSAKGLWFPVSIKKINGDLFVTEKGPCRVGIFEGIPTTNHPTLSYVIGQQSPHVQCISFGIATAKRISQAWSTATDGTKLIVSDVGNNRVLIYNTIPTTSDASANVVLGQPDMVSNTANNGGLSASSIQSFTGTDPNLGRGEVFTDGTKLFFTDAANNRVLIWNTIPTVNNTPADVVVGQPNFTSNTANNGGVSGASLNSPRGVKVIGGKLYVTDYSNHRILIWNTVPTTNGVAADLVLGQPNLTSNTANNGGVSASSLYQPMYVNEHAGKLYVADYRNQRVLIWNTIPTVNNTPADIVLGQVNFTTTTINGAGLSASSLNYPTEAVVIDNKLYISDFANNRVVIHNTIPTSNNEDADVVIGQQNFTQNSLTFGGDLTFNRPTHFITDTGKFVVADQLNNRIMIWNSIPTSSYPLDPDVLIGQPTLNTNDANHGGLSAFSINSSESAIICNNKLLVSDYLNHRILVWNTVPTVDNTPADVVIGQPNMTSNTLNNGGRSARSLYGNVGLKCVGNKLVVNDSGNRRFLIFNAIPTTDYALADVVIGQPDFTSGTGNNGGLSNKSLNSGAGEASSNGTNLVVPDTYNNRVLIFNTVPTTNFAQADVVIGQPDFTSNTANNGGISASSMYMPKGVHFDGTRLFVVDSRNHRILGWNSMPTTNFQAADFVIGQDNFTTVVESISNTGLVFPGTVSTYNGKVFVSDTYNHRILGYPFGPQEANVSAPSKTTTRNVTVQLSAQGAKEMLVSTKSDFSDAVWEPYSTSKDMIVSSGDGVKQIYVKYRDYANYEGSILSASTTLDTTGPLGAISIVSPNNNGSTNNQNVTLLINGSDTLSGVTHMMVSSSSNFTGGVWETYSTSKSWTLSDGDGLKMVYIKFKDKVGNVSKTYSSSITLDTTTEVEVLKINDQEYTQDQVYKVQPIPTISGTGEEGSIVLIKWEDKILGETTVKNDGTWSWTPTEELGNGVYDLSIEQTDNAGNKVVKGLSIEVTGNSTNTDNEDIDYPTVTETPSNTDTDTVNTTEDTPNYLLPIFIILGILLFVLILFFIKRRRDGDEEK